MPFALGRVVELHRAEQIAVIGHGDGGHLLLDHDLHQLVDFAGAVEQGIVGVAMQVDERHSKKIRFPGEVGDSSILSCRNSMCEYRVYE